MKLLILDIDGTLFNDGHRKHYSDAGNWKAYHKHHVDDTPYLTMFQVMCNWADKGFDVLYLTGRHEAYRSSTLIQIQKYRAAFVNGNSEFLLMRQDEDTMPTCEFKAAAVKVFISGYHSVEEIVFYDDSEANLKSVADVCCELNIKHSTYLADSGAATLIDSYLPASPELYKVPNRANVFAPKAPTAEILRSMADTFEERNKVYGSNYERVAPIMKILFPDGLPPEILHSDQWHLFELIVVKITRFAISGLQHKDSIHDIGVYAAMIESILEKQNG